MKAKSAKILQLGAIIGVAMTIGLNAPAPALAADAGGSAAATQSAGNGKIAAITDFSARKRSRHYSYAPWPFNGLRNGRHADPSYGPGTAQFRQARRQGRCVMDEGYGRWFSCSNI